jgi:hypothetical protein
MGNASNCQRWAFDHPNAACMTRCIFVKVRVDGTDNMRVIIGSSLVKNAQWNRYLTGRSAFSEALSLSASLETDSHESVLESAEPLEALLFFAFLVGPFRREVVAAFLTLGMIVDGSTGRLIDRGNLGFSNSNPLFADTDIIQLMNNGVFASGEMGLREALMLSQNRAASNIQRVLPSTTV